MRNILLSIFIIHSLFSVAQNNCLDIVVTALQDADCNSQNSYSGSASISVSNGSGNYVYEWLQNNSPLFPPQTAPTANNLLPGDYIVEVTDITNNCSEEIEISIGYVGLIDASLSFSAFTDNPVYYNQWTFDTVKIYNYGCETRVRPEFRISHPNTNVATNDFDIEYYDALAFQWVPIQTVNDNGDVLGYYGDSIGTILNQPLVSQTVRVRFNPSADIGMYTSENELWEVDLNGDYIQKLDSLNFLSLELEDACPTFNSSANVFNASCFGVSDGSIEVGVSGGSPPYTFLWSNNSQSQNINFLQADTYSVVIQDVGFCTLFDTIVVTQPPNGVPDNRYADQLSATSATLNFEPSIQIDQYRFRYRPIGFSNWDVVGIGFLNSIAELDSTKNINNLFSNTTYEWQMKTWGMNGCIDGWSDSEFFTTLCVDGVDVDSIPISCHNGSDGQINLQVYGNGQYSVLWSNQETSLSVSDLSAGTYQYTITDTSGCVFSDSITLSNPDEISINLPQTVYFCGLDTVLDAGFFQNYLWSTGDTTQSINVSTSGLFTVEVSDNVGCTSSDSTIVSIINNQPNLSSVTLCQGESVDLYAENTSDYNNLWYNNLWSPVNVYSDSITITPSISTSYFLISSNNNHSCYYNIDVQLVAMPSTDLSVTPISCFGEADGSAQSVMSDGTPPYSYSWSNGSVLSSANDLAVGYAFLTVIDSNNCQITDSIFVTQPQQLGINSVVDQPSCYGFTDGQIAASVSGGQQPYNLLWSNGDTINTIDSIASGSYTLQITDSNNCLYTETVQLGQPDQLVVTENSSFHQDVSCFGGSDGEVQLSASGGTPNFSYSIDNVSYQTSPNFTNLSAANSWFYVKDNNNCQDSIILNILQPQQALILQEILSSHQNVSCSSFSDGQLEIVSSGGVSPYSYVLNQDTVSIGLFDSLTAGLYQLTAIDANNCIVDTSIQITEPTPLSLSYTFTQPSCYAVNDGELVAQISGGTPNYFTTWEGIPSDTLQNISAGNYQLIVVDDNNCTDTLLANLSQPNELILSEVMGMHQNVSCFGLSDGQVQLIATGGQPTYFYQLLDSTFQTQNTFDNLASGNYTFLVNDLNNCTDTFSLQITEPDELILIENPFFHSDIICFGGNEGQLQVEASGGLPNYTYSLEGGMPQSSGLFTDLSAGLYALLVSDANLCTSDTLEIQILTPTNALILSEDTLNHQDVLCFSDSSGSFSVIASGGLQPYQYYINQQMMQPQNFFDSLVGGSYLVTVIDSNLCTDQITIEIEDPTAITINLSATNPTCYNANDAIVSSDVSGGQPPYTYLWSNSSSNDSLINVPVDLYELFITDSNNCQQYSTIQLTQPAQLQISASVNNVNCFNSSDGFVELFASGGTPSYLFNIDGNPFSANTNFNNLDEGTYSFNVVDGNNCTDTLTVAITQADSLFIDSLHVIDVDCFGYSNGAITIEAEGGFGPYLYKINNEPFQTDSIFLNLSAQLYTVTIQDANNCTFSDTLQINQADSLQITLNETDASCYGINDGELFSTVLTGGTSPFMYSIDAILFYSTGLFSSLGSGTDSLYIIDSLGCEYSYLYEINEPDSIMVSVVAQEPSCYAYCDGVVEAIVMGSNNYTLIWSDFSSALVNDSLCDGLISLTVLDSLGCSNFYSYNLQQPPPVFPIVIQNGNTLTTSVNFTTYQWYGPNGLINGANSYQFFPQENGQFWVEVVDSNGCTGSSLTYDFVLTSTINNENKHFNVFPNPVKDQLFVDFQGSANWQMFDIHGVKVAEGFFEGHTDIDISFLKQGIYTLQIANEHEFYNTKIVKQK